MTWIKHHPTLSAQALGWERLSELSSNSTTAAVRAGDLSPNTSEFGWSVWSSLLRLSLVDVSDSLSQIERSLFLALDTFDFEERSLMVSVALASLVVDNLALHVKSIEKEKKKRKRRKKQVSIKNRKRSFPPSYSLRPQPNKRTKRIEKRAVRTMGPRLWAWQPAAITCLLLLRVSLKPLLPGGYHTGVAQAHTYTSLLQPLKQSSKPQKEAQRRRQKSKSSPCDTQPSLSHTLSLSFASSRPFLSLSLPDFLASHGEYYFSGVAL